MRRANHSERARYAIILAGGDASRLMPLTRRITGRPIPKQFCPVVGEDSLLEQTRRRVALALSPRRTLLVLTRHHTGFYGSEIDEVPETNLVIQPDNRGTAAAILYALLRVAKLNPYASVTLFPSDHYVDNDRRFMAHASLAMDAASSYPAQLVLLGVRPDRPEPGYGWIEPCGNLAGECGLQRVARFWEKPPKALAQKLWNQGCLWNTFVVSGTVRAFLRMVRRALPDLRRSFSAVWHALGTPDEHAAMERLYAAISANDFCRDVLAPNARALAVLPMAGIYWNDLGDPRRVYETLARSRIRPSWMAQRDREPLYRNDFVRRRIPQITPVRDPHRKRG
jgi:mannose-1-phosphate guanylyltransferase